MKKYIQSYKKAIKELEEELKYTRHNVIYPGLEVRSVITHEFGHVLADQKIFQINRLRSGSLFSYDQNNIYWQKCKLVDDVFAQARSNGDIYKISKNAADILRNFLQNVSLCMIW